MVQAFGAPDTASVEHEHLKCLVAAEDHLAVPLVEIEHERSLDGVLIDFLQCVNINIVLLRLAVSASLHEAHLFRVGKQLRVEGNVLPRCAVARVLRGQEHEWNAEPHDAGEPSQRCVGHSSEPESGPSIHVATFANDIKLRRPVQEDAVLMESDSSTCVLFLLLSCLRGKASNQFVKWSSKSR